MLSKLISLYITWFWLLKPSAVAKANSFGVLEDNILYGIFNLSVQYLLCYILAHTASF